MDKTQEMKNLEDVKSKLKTEVHNLLNQIKPLQKEHANKVAQLDNVCIQIKKYKPNKIKVTEHAILRYIERVMGFDLETISNAILTDDVKKSIYQFGTCNMPFDDKHQIVVKEYSIITII